MNHAPATSTPRPETPDNRRALPPPANEAEWSARAAAILNRMTAACAALGGAAAGMRSIDEDLYTATLDRKLRQFAWLQWALLAGLATLAVAFAISAILGVRL
jgi:hypothetical protein